VRSRWLAHGLPWALALLFGSPIALADDVPTFADRDDDAIEDADTTAAIVAEPLAVAYGVFAAEANIVVQRSLAVAIDAGGYRQDTAILGGVAAGLLVYPLHPALHGLYLEPRIVYTHALSLSAASTTGTLSMGALCGWQWTWDYGLSIRLGAGAAGVVGDRAVRASALLPEVSIGRLALVADAGLGWAW
jgi:hypothetical protein